MKNRQIFSICKKTKLCKIIFREKSVSIHSTPLSSPPPKSCETRKCFRQPDKIYQLRDDPFLVATLHNKETPREKYSGTICILYSARKSYVTLLGFWLQTYINQGFLTKHCKLLKAKGLQNC